MSLLHYRADEPGPTGRFSWWKAVGGALGVLSLAPPVLWYLEMGPATPWYVPPVLTAFLAVLGVGIYKGKGEGAFTGLLGAAEDRIRDGG